MQNATGALQSNPVVLVAFVPGHLGFMHAQAFGKLSLGQPLGDPQAKKGDIVLKLVRR